jgi:hypothetical protein
MTLHLTRSSRLWTFQLLGFEVFQVLLQKKKKYFNRFHKNTKSGDFSALEYRKPISNGGTIPRKFYKFN